MSKCFVKKKSSTALSSIEPLLFFSACVITVLLFVFSVEVIGEKSEQERLESAQRAIVKATVQCYALEGAFPTSVEYLKQHYGLQVDLGKYIVDYSFTAGNMMPVITVLPRYFKSLELPKSFEPAEVWLIAD